MRLLQARVLVPFVRGDGVPWHEGHVLLLRPDEYRQLYGLGYVAREFVPVYGPAVGRAYLHAVRPSGVLIDAPHDDDAPVLRVDVPYDVAPPPTPQRPVASRPARAVPVNPSAPPVIRRGCGCGGRRV